MTKLRWIVLACAFALYPAVADAAWWEWLERLSGPGPFKGGGGVVRLFCTHEKNDTQTTQWWCMRDGEPDIRQVLEVRAGFLTSGNRARFDDAPAETDPVHVVRFSATEMIRVHPMLDVGAGAGFLRFSGKGFDPLYRFTLTPLSVSFVPFAIARPDGRNMKALVRLLRVRFDETYITQGFNGATDFGSKSTYAVRSELVRSVGVVLDFGVFLPR